MEGPVAAEADEQSQVAKVNKKDLFQHFYCLVRYFNIILLYLYLINRTESFP